MNALIRPSVPYNSAGGGSRDGRVAPRLHLVAELPGEREDGNVVGHYDLVDHEAGGDPGRGAVVDGGAEAVRVDGLGSGLRASRFKGELRYNDLY